MFKEEDRAWDVSDIGGMDKYILLCLAHRKNGATQLCCPSIGTIMRDTGVCKDTVRKALKVLVAKGYVTYTRNPGGKTEYQLSIPGGKVDPVGKSTGYESTPGEGGKVDPEGVEKSTPNMEVNKELNKEGENPLPPPSPAAKREAQTHRFSLSEIPDASKEKTRTHQAFKPPELGVELTESAFRDWMTVRKAKHSPLTETAWKHFKAQVLRSELSIQQAVELCAAKGWISINAEWQAVKDYQAEFDSRSSNDRKVDFVIKALGLTDNRKETEK